MTTSAILPAGFGTELETSKYLWKRWIIFGVLPTASSALSSQSLERNPVNATITGPDLRPPCHKAPTRTIKNDDGPGEGGSHSSTVFDRPNARQKPWFCDDAGPEVGRFVF